MTPPPSTKEKECDEECETLQLQKPRTPRMGSRY
jgi:hypothetical protein